jgi:hypothetical protein
MRGLHHPNGKTTINAIAIIGLMMVRTMIVSLLPVNDH